MSITNVPSISWVNGNPVLPAESDILAGVQADINTAFGGGVNPSLQTPQGQIAQSETAIIGDKNDQIAYLVNQFNPSLASGQFQDAIGDIYFIKRIQAAGTVVNCTVIGAVGTVIPAGSTAQDTAGYIYTSTGSATIPSTGTTTIQFQNLTVGAIPCAPNTLNIIYSAIAGWNTINNPSAGALGNLVESRTAFEYRRQQSVAKNSVNSITSIQGNILALSGVIGAYTVDNPTNSSINFGSTSYPIAAHTTLVSVAGGSAADIANTIWQNKGAGSPYPAAGGAGIQSYTIYDTNYDVPYPSYLVTWLVPTSTNTYFIVNIKNIPTLPANVIPQIQAAVVNSFYGNDDGIKAAIGQTTFSGRYYANVSAVDPSVEILSIFLGTTVSPTGTQLQYGIDQLPVTSTSNVVVNLV